MTTQATTGGSAPLITLVTATYNAGAHLPNLIESLRAQTNRNFAWIVMDGASQDDTLAVLDTASDVVTLVKSEADFGIYHALNKAIDLACSEYYLVLGADDFLEPTAVDNYCKAALQSNADIVSGAVMVDGVNIRPPAKPIWWRSSPLLVSAHSVGALIRRDLHKELGYYSRRFPIAADTFFFLLVWRAGKRVYRIDKVVGSFGSGGVSGTDILGGLCESFRANAEVRGYLFIHFFLLTLRLLKNASRIRRDLFRRKGGVC
jgi:glycosyltransferase involved in cell wall biosynthesis